MYDLNKKGLHVKNKDAKIDTNLLFLGISNLKPVTKIYAKLGGVKGQVEHKKVDIKKTDDSFQPDYKADTGIRDVLDTAYVISTLSKEEPCPVTFVLYCDLDKSNYEEFINEWVEKVRTVKHTQDRSFLLE